ncbi:MAG TPA: hypothetical protein VM925_02365 [Labilithrix sp.]|nr:hypothetical protein [Labilithrix sp.]
MIPSTSLRSVLPFLAVPVLWVMTACDDPNELTRRTGRPSDDKDGAASETAQALECTVKPDGRSYASFDGTKLEATRVNENQGVNRARLKPYTVLAGEYRRVLGVVPAGLAEAASSFDNPPARWHADLKHSGITIAKLFELSFEGCKELTKTGAEYGAFPDAVNAKTICGNFIRKAWSRSASPDELAECTELAAKELATEEDVRVRWAYVCASVLSSSQFLTF